MTGDDIETDVLAAQRHGGTQVLVKTGKYLPRTHHSASGIDSWDHLLPGPKVMPSRQAHPRNGAAAQHLADRTGLADTAGRTERPDREAAPGHDPHPWPRTNSAIRRCE